MGRISADPIRFAYDPEYLESPSAHALPFSLPLQPEPYDEDAMNLLPWVADDFCEEIIPRLKVLEKIMRG